MDNLKEKFPIVDEEGCVVGSATRGECHNGSRLLHPVVHLHVFNTAGDIYLRLEDTTNLMFLKLKVRSGSIQSETPRMEGYTTW